MRVTRKALMVGINEYDNFRRLDGCVADATKMFELLGRNDDKNANYECRLLTSPSSTRITRAMLRAEWQKLFRNFSGEVLFYFSGHGMTSDTGALLVTQDGTQAEPGLPMSELTKMAEKSKASEVLILLDCCFAGDAGDTFYSQLPGASPHAELRQGMTILAAAGPAELAKEEGGHGVFTSLALQALAGGAADPRGYVSAASVYAYADQVLGAWDQRPLFKTYASSLGAIRRCKPQVDDHIIRDLPALFSTPDSRYKLTPKYEFTHKSADAKCVKIFNKFKQYRDAGMLRTVNGKDLYFTALKYGQVELTPLGKLYWWLAEKNRI